MTLWTLVSAVSALPADDQRTRGGVYACHIAPENLVPDRSTPRASEDFAHGDKSVLPSVPLPIDHPTIGVSMSTGSF
jgi:hypothetical protein